MKIIILSLLAFGFAGQAAMALTVKESEVVNKIRDVSLQQVRINNDQKLILADAKGISVYTFDNDSVGKSNCTGSCLTEWPPLNVDAAETITAPFGKIMGNNNKPQLTLKGLPLYYYDDDKKPGDVFGNYPKWHPVFVTK